MLRVLLLLSLVSSLASSVSSPLSAQASERGRVHAYFTSWSIYARGFNIGDVDATKITHLVYAFAKVENGRIALGDRYADIEKFYSGDSWDVGALRGSFRRMQLLKQATPGLKTLISIGGANASQGFSFAVASAVNRTFFVRSIVDFVVRYGFDGVDIDWEWPGDTNAQDPVNFASFLADLRLALDARGRALSRSFEITVNVPADPVRVARLDLAKIASSVDAMHLVTIDYFIPIANQSNPISHFVAPLRRIAGDPTPLPYRTSFNVEATIDLYAKSVARRKMLIGIPFYGRGYAGIAGGTNGLFAKHTGPTSFGTWGAGIFDYTDLEANYIGKQGYSSHWNADARVPRSYNAALGVMITHESPRSVREKAWLAKSKGLGGVMLWELSADRKSSLLGEIDAEAKRPRLEASRHEISVSAPSNVDLAHDAGTGSAGKLYILFASLSGNAPGIPLPGGNLPINFDAFTNFVLSAPNSPLFPASIGFTDAAGRASPKLAFSVLASLPANLIGQRITCATWTFDGLASANGVPSNAVEVLLGS